MKTTLSEALKQIAAIKEAKKISTSDAAKLFCKDHEVFGVSGKQLSPETLRVRFNERLKTKKFVFGGSRLKRIERSSAKIAFLKLRLAIIEDRNLSDRYQDISYHIAKIESQYA